MPDERLNADQGVHLIVRGLQALNRRVIVYEYVYEWGFRSPNLAWVYVLGSMLILTIVLATSSAWGGAGRMLVAAMVLVAAYRSFDLLCWYANFLLDRRHNHVSSRLSGTSCSRSLTSSRRC